MIDDAMVCSVLEEQSEAYGRGALSMWTIFHNPAFPHTYWARRFDVGGGNVVATDSSWFSSDLATLRDALSAAGLVCMIRSDEDDEHIVETWM